MGSLDPIDNVVVCEDGSLAATAPGSTTTPPRNVTTNVASNEIEPMLPKQDDGIAKPRFRENHCNTQKDYLLTKLRLVKDTIHRPYIWVYM